tara:strand:- start:113 stop:364 length:252 start_codon:yes stop_codon:yes gene_type:complete
VQSTAMIGPTMTLVSTGNIYQAGVSYSANKAVENETGVPTTKYIINKMENSQRKNTSKVEDEMNNSLKILLELNLEKTRKLIN